MDIKFIRQNPELVKEGCRKRGVKVDVYKILRLDKEKRELMVKLENLKAEQNKISQRPTQKEVAQLRKIKNEIKKIAIELGKVDKDLNQLIVSIPNLPLPDIPYGRGEEDNVVLYEKGEKRRFDFQPKNYLTIAEKLDIIDIKRAAKVSGTRFGYLKGELVLLEFALINFTFKTLIKDGFIPLLPPVLIRSEMMKAMGYIDTKEDLAERYYLEKDSLFLIGTAEQSIGPMHADEIFSEKDLPRRYLAFSTCFREEAGAYGKDTRGILRVHQFDKIEMFSFCRPEDSKKEHKFLLRCQEKLMHSLKIPYRVVQVCTGDLARPSAATYDIEAWLPGQNCYRETHSTSNCTDFQARRLDIRYRDQKTKKLNFVHTLNGTAFAIGRTIIAIIENCQRKDGGFDWPEVLKL